MTAEFLAAMKADPQHCLLATDFDGVLAPIVTDPQQARIDPGARAALVRMIGLVGQVRVITGRPTRTVVALGGLDAPDLRGLQVMGQYGVERWSSLTGQHEEPEIPASLAVLRERLPELVDPWPGVAIEDKGRALAVHTRTAVDPKAALAALTGPVTELATDLGLTTEPGKQVLEVRSSGMDKGQALHEAVRDLDARSVVYLGDDRGDLPAFEAVRELRARGVASCGVWVSSDEQPGELGDLVVDGPAGAAAWLHQVADQLS